MRVAASEKQPCSRAREVASVSSLSVHVFRHFKRKTQISPLRVKQGAKQEELLDNLLNK